MWLALIKAVPGRSYRCLDCSGEDPIKRPDVIGWLKSELKPPK